MTETMPFRKIDKNKISTVLLIDDDNDEHALFTNALNKFDSHITCLTAYNCLEGYTLTKNKTPDAIFLDMNLPGTNGIACLRKLRKNVALSKVPVFMYSCAASTDKDSVAFDLGALAWIRKPDSIEGYQKMFAAYFP